MNPCTTEHQTSAVVLTSVSLPSAWDREGMADLNFYCGARRAAVFLLEWQWHFGRSKIIMYLSGYVCLRQKRNRSWIFSCFPCMSHPFH